MAYCWVQTPGLLKRRKRNISPQKPLLSSHWVQQEKYECEATLTADGVQLAKDWTQLPPEVLAFIFGFLSRGKDRRNVQLVCRSWNGVMNLKSLWKNSYICIRKTAAVASASTALWLRLQARGITRFCISCIKESNLALFMKKLVDFAPKTVSLDLHFAESADLGRRDFLSTISQLQSLRKLGLSGKGSQYVLHMAALLASLPGLQELSLFTVPNVRLESIRHEKLKVLVLEKMGRLKSSETCILLQELPCLEQLEIKACSYDRWCFNSSFQPGLNTEIIYSSGYDQDTNEIIYCSGYDQDTKLVKLSLARSNFDESEVSFPRRLLFLQSLDLSSCRLDQEYLSDILGQLLYLKELNLSGITCYISNSIPIDKNMRLIISIMAHFLPAGLGLVHLAGTKIALRSRVCLCVRLQLSRVLSCIIRLLCHCSHERSGSYWKFAGSIG